MALQRNARVCNVRRACAGEKTETLRCPLSAQAQPSLEALQRPPSPFPLDPAASPFPVHSHASQADNGPLCSEREIITAKARCQGEARLCPITVWLKGCVSFRFFLSLYGQAAKHRPSPQSAQGTEVCFELGFHCLHSLPTHVWSDSIAVCSSEE